MGSLAKLPSTIRRDIANPKQTLAQTLTKGGHALIVKTKYSPATNLLSVLDTLDNKATFN
jgi:hypothetical protein